MLTEQHCLRTFRRRLPRLRTPEPCWDREATWVQLHKHYGSSHAKAQVRVMCP